MSQEEEESPAEGSKDDPGEQTEVREDAEAPTEDPSPPPTPAPKEDAMPEGEKAAPKENEEKPEAQVSCGQEASLGCRHNPPSVYPEDLRLWPEPFSLLPRSPVRRGLRGLRPPLQPPRRRRSRSPPGSRRWWRRLGWSWWFLTYLTCLRMCWPARHSGEH